MEKAALIISIISVIGTVLLGIYSNRLTKNIARKDLSKGFFERIFFETIAIDLPVKLKKFEYEGSIRVQESIEDLKSLVVEILEKAFFYKYFDQPFYDKIKKVLLEIEDILVVMPDNSRQDKIKSDKEDIQRLFDKLYKILREYYMELSYNSK